MVLEPHLYLYLEMLVGTVGVKWELVCSHESSVSWVWVRKFSRNSNTLLRRVLFVTIHSDLRECLLGTFVSTTSHLNSVPLWSSDTLYMCVTIGDFFLIPGGRRVGVRRVGWPGIGTVHVWNGDSHCGRCAPNQSWMGSPNDRPLDPKCPEQPLPAGTKSYHSDWSRMGVFFFRYSFRGQWWLKGGLPSVHDRQETTTQSKDTDV